MATTFQTFRHVPRREMTRWLVWLALALFALLVLATSPAAAADAPRWGKVADAQGLASIKPATAQRWTPICGRVELEPGDLLRTDLRGANALSIRLADGGMLTLGPGALVEMKRPDAIVVFSGEVEVALPAGKSLEVAGPGKSQLKLFGKQVLRARDEKLTKLEAEPAWLKGFRSAATEESLGSLITTIDGRSVPLTVGYHKVSVDIRDQIARTVVEESFVNHTGARLEGVFHFPLPADASISGFGMWIGDKLVEADVVEKQRAREIYETILRERRDPGLLEWSGGNIFKARVFPIEPHSEKRIKITYTQVLPLAGGSYRYSYALQSELLRQNPLRELNIDVQVHSALPIAGISSPTHEVRQQTTAKSARVEFTAQEYTLSRDFEVVIDVGQAPAVTMIPHRRGDDGYFVLMLQPPGDRGAWTRELVRDGQPLDLVILADTSGSMDRTARKAQAVLISTLLASLGERDTFQLGLCDVDCLWTSPSPVSATPEHAAEALEQLAKRPSLGWTNLDKTFAAVVPRLKEHTQVIYVGDGITTTGDADPVAFAARLKLMMAGKQGTFHAVATSSSYESAVLAAMVSLGGGSVRRIGADSSPTSEGSPQSVARALLVEITEPGLRDLKLDFKGLRVARVYPEQLPNLAAGRQQIVLGRYLPEKGAASGEVVVTGTQNGKQVTFHAAVELDQAEQGNSFIPRLWARLHLDTLLDQGASQTIRDEIIALSEEYQIMTPYTSFLVLETDADRERFKVERRFQMRDGEKFFAEGRNQSQLDLLAQHMKQAANWRKGIRRQVVRELASLGRDPRLLQLYLPQSQLPGLWNGTYFRSTGGFGGMGGGGGRGGYANGPMSGTALYEDFFLGDALGIDSYAHYDRRSKFNTWDFNGGASDESPVGGTVAYDSERGISDLTAADEGFLELADRDFDGAGLQANFLGRMAGEPRQDLGWFGAAGFGMSVASKLKADFDFSGPMRGGVRFEQGRAMKPFGGRSMSEKGLFEAPHGYYGPTLDSLFPNLAAAPGKVKPPPADVAWPAEARTLAESLLRTAQFERLAKASQGLRIAASTDSYDVRRAMLARQSQQTALVMHNAWSIRNSGDQSQTIVDWCDGKLRGVFSQMNDLGRQRASTPADLARPPMSLADYSLQSIERTYQTYKPVISTPEANRAMLTLVQERNPEHAVEVLVDTERHVILSITQRHKGKATSTTRFDKFVEAAGGHWATQVETLDEKERRVSLTTLDVQVVDAKKFAELLAEQLAPRGQVLALAEPLPTLREAKQKVASGKADFSAQMVVLAHFASLQQWPKIEAPLAAVKQIAAGKPGFQWINDVVLLVSRKHETLLGELYAAADAVAKDKPKLSLGDQYALSGELARFASGVLQNQEQMTLADKLRRVYEQQPKHLLAMHAWWGQRAGHLDAAGQTDEAFEIRKRLAADNPFDQSLQTQYAQALTGRGEYQAAYEWIAKVLAADFAWTDYEQDSLRGLVASWLDQQGEFDRLVDYLRQWTALDPHSATPYQQLLSALLRTDRIAESDKLLAEWLKLAQGEAPLSPGDNARLSAAVNHALGHGYGVYSDEVEDRWLAPLGQTVRQLVRRKDQLGLANQIVTNSRFRNSDEIRALQSFFVETLKNGAGTLDPQQVNYLIDWVIAGEVEVDKAMWRDLAERLEKRWAAAKVTTIVGNENKAALAQPLLKILNSRATPVEVLAFLRRQLKEGGEEQRASHAQTLLDTLLAQPWSQANEDEAFALLDQTVPPAAVVPPADGQNEDADARLAQEVLTLQRIVDALIASRAKAENDKLEHPETLSRTELAAKRQASEKVARTALADRLAKERNKHGDAMAPWIDAERLYWEVKIERDPEGVAATAWEFLGPKPPAPAQLDGESLLSAVLRNRYLTTLEWIATRKDAPAGLAERLLSYFDAAIAADAEDSAWKHHAYRLLVALDRPVELEKALRAWIRPEVVESTWRIALGYVLAEQSKLAEAIAQFEAVRAADELPAAEYRSLAGWYLAGDDQRRHNESLVASFMAEGENRLYQHLSAKAQAITRNTNQGAEPIDNQTLMLLGALMQKSATPQNYYWILRQMYDATHDFRLLESTAQAMVGNTALKIYPLLGNMRQLLTEVRDEATVDSIVDELAKVSAQATTETDRRAVDLLEMLVERRAAELKNQPGPHAAKALAALQRAFQRPWAEGEPRLMADLLGSLGTIADRTLSAEQLAELQALANIAPASGVDRLHIVGILANTLAGAQRLDDAVARLQIALDAFRQAHGGRLTASANDELAILVSLVSRQGRFVRAETLVQNELKQPANQQQRTWLLLQLYRVYYSALDAGGSTAAGKGVDVYRDAQAKIIADLATGTPDFRYQLVNQLCEIYRKAHEKKLPGVAADAVAFGDKTLPGVLRQQTHYYETLLGAVGDTIHTVSGPRPALAFLISRMEEEPAWIKYSGRNRWNHVVGRMGAWRAEVKNLGDLDPRLLKLVTRELRHMLLTGNSHDRSMYYRHHQYYWAEKEVDFAATAEAVLKERGTSPRVVLQVAQYLYQGLERYGRAIEVMQIAHAAKVLDVSGQAQLVIYLHEQKRFRESIDLLASLVERFPDTMLYRTQLMHAYFRTDQPAKLQALLAETDAYFHDQRRWGAGPLAALAYSTLENQLWERSIAYYKELIPLHERTAPNRGIGDGTLSSYYAQQSQAFVKLGRTPEAVEAASAAIVSWGATHNNRQDAVKNLHSVLAAAPDLDAFVKVLDGQVKQSGLENPTVRHQIGKVYADRRDYVKAITQLRAAVEVQPGDNALQELLVTTLLAAHDTPGAAAQLLAWADVARRDLTLYKRLAELYQKLEQPAEAERAYTTLVEMQPLESESHSLLAEVRQAQNRWPEAADQWREVARIRELEPTGLLKLADAQIHLQDWDAASQTLRALAKKDWPPRFNTVQAEVQRMQEVVKNRK